MPLGLGLGGTSLVGGAVSGIGSIFGAGKSASAAKDAASIQAQAAQQAAALQYQMYQQTAQRLAPWVGGGQQALQMLTNRLSLTPMADGTYMPMSGQLERMPTTWGMTSQFAPSMADLEKTPGYQFTRQQGLQATTNAYAAQGLGGSITGARISPSGPLAAGQTQYATGLASNTFNQQYQNWLAGQNFQLGSNLQTYNMLAGLSGAGQNAAANTGQFGSAAVTGANQALLGGAAAQASGVVGAANAWNQGLGAAGSSFSNAILMSSLLNQPGMFGNPAAGTSLAGPGPGTGGLY